MKKLFFLFLTWRLALWVPILLGVLYLPTRNGYDYTLFSDYIKYFHLPPLSFLLTSFANFDGSHYITIAHFGYTINAGFFPLFPLLLRMIATIITFIVPIQLDAALLYAGLLLNSSLFLLSLYVFYKLLIKDYPKKTALQAIIFLLCFPTSFFFAAVYNESLFFCLLLLVFYFSRQKKWLWVALFGFLLTATRFVGIAILPALLYEYIKVEKISIKKLTNHWILWGKLTIVSLVTLSGIGIYTVFNYIKWENPFYFIHAQGAFKNDRSVSSLILFPQTVVRYIKILATVSPNLYEWRVALLELSMFLFTIMMLIIAWKKKVRMSYLIFSVLCFLIPISTGTFSGVPRYVIVLFPIYISLALIKNRIIKAIYLIISILLLFVLFMLFTRGYYIA